MQARPQERRNLRPAADWPLGPSYQSFRRIGGCARTRTVDPLIKSQLLYHLSYAPGPSG